MRASRPSHLLEDNAPLAGIQPPPPPPTPSAPRREEYGPETSLRPHTMPYETHAGLNEVPSAEPAGATGVPY
ncbi:hypothetical protein Sste5344_010614, partial [Sporothrix stenoceras]